MAPRTRSSYHRPARPTSLSSLGFFATLLHIASASPTPQLHPPPPPSPPSSHNAQDSKPTSKMSWISPQANDMFKPGELIIFQWTATSSSTRSSGSGSGDHTHPPAPESFRLCVSGKKPLGHGVGALGGVPRLDADADSDPDSEELDVSLSAPAWSKSSYASAIPSSAVPSGPSGTPTPSAWVATTTWAPASTWVAPSPSPSAWSAPSAPIVPVVPVAPTLPVANDGFASDHWSAAGAGSGDPADADADADTAWDKRSSAPNQSKNPREHIRRTVAPTNSHCGAQMWTSVQQEGGTYSVEFTIPNMTSHDPFFLELFDASGQVGKSPSFRIHDPSANLHTAIAAIPKLSKTAIVAIAVPLAAFALIAALACFSGIRVRLRARRAARATRDAKNARLGMDVSSKIVLDDTFAAATAAPAGIKDQSLPGAESLPSLPPVNEPTKCLSRSLTLGLRDFKADFFASRYFGKHGHHRERSSHDLKDLEKALAIADAMEMLDERNERKRAMDERRGSSGSYNSRDSYTTLPRNGKRHSERRLCRDSNISGGSTLPRRNSDGTLGSGSGDSIRCESYEDHEIPEGHEGHALHHVQTHFSDMSTYSESLPSCTSSNPPQVHYAGRMHAELPRLVAAPSTTTSYMSREYVEHIPPSCSRSLPSILQRPTLPRVLTPSTNVYDQSLSAHLSLNSNSNPSRPGLNVLIPPDPVQARVSSSSAILGSLPASPEHNLGRAPGFEGNVTTNANVDADMYSRVQQAIRPPPVAQLRSPYSPT